jgi:hypothetical protein
MFRRTALMTAMMVLRLACYGQSARVARLDIIVENQVIYRNDNPDPSTWAKQTVITAAPGQVTFHDFVGIGDVVSVNGKPAKGIWTTKGIQLPFSPNPTPGNPIVNVAVASGEGPHGECTWVLYTADGRYVGRLTDRGTFQHVVSGGGGAYFGARGQHFTGPLGTTQRNASITEDPSLRQVLGGGKWEAYVYLIPEQWPDIEVTDQGPSVFHADFTLVTNANPAHRGEALIVRAKGLGPTLPNLVPVGFQPFGSNPYEEVNSPVEATVGGVDAPVLVQMGWPGTTDSYRVDFQVPAGLPPGQTSVQLTAAWIPGLPVTISIK